MIAEGQFRLRGSHCKLARLIHAVEVSAVQGIHRGGIQHNLVALVDDQVRHVIVHNRAVAHALPGDRVQTQLRQRLVQQGLVVGEILHIQPRDGVDRGAIGGAQGLIDMPAGGIARAHQVAELHVHVVEQEGDEAVRHIDCGLVLTWLVGVGG